MGARFVLLRLLMKSPDDVGFFHVVEDVVEPFLLSFRYWALVNPSGEGLIRLNIEFVLVPVDVEDLAK